MMSYRAIQEVSVAGLVWVIGNPVANLRQSCELPRGYNKILHIYTVPHHGICCILLS